MTLDTFQVDMSALLCFRAESPPAYEECITDNTITYTSASALPVTADGELPPAYQRVLEGEFNEIIVTSLVRQINSLPTMDG